jgi:hypothetical protein
MANRVNTVLKRKPGRRGPPRTSGPGTLIGIRAHKDFLKRLDAWRATEVEPLSRNAAILKLATVGLDLHEDRAFLARLDAQREPGDKGMSRTDLILALAHAALQILERGDDATHLAPSKR